MTTFEALYISMIIIEILLFASLAVYAIYLSVSWLHGAPYVATRNDELKDILAKANLKKGMCFIELGCGDGRVIRTAVRDYDVRGVGYDINPILIFTARILAKFQNLKQTMFAKRNVLNVDLSQADVIYIFLLPPLVLKLKDTLMKKTKKNALIIAHGFKIPFLQKYLIDEIQGTKFKTYYYKRV